MRGRHRPPPTSLKRRKPSRGPKIAVTIFAEGSRTEVFYFKAVKSDAQNRLVEISGGCGVPETLVSTAIAHKKRRRQRARDSFERDDQVWAVFDRDEHDVASAIARAKAQGVMVAYSNPCFELWGLLHYVNHDAPIDRHALQKLLETHMDGYDKDGAKVFSYDDMREGYADASRRAEQMENRRIAERAEMENPYTGV